MNIAGTGQPGIDRLTVLRMDAAAKRQARTSSSTAYSKPESKSARDDELSDEGAHLESLVDKFGRLVKERRDDQNDQHLGCHEQRDGNVSTR